MTRLIEDHECIKPMYNYFKPVHDLYRLFQQAIDTLHQHGYDAAKELIEEALRHDPYNLAAHTALAIYYATVKNKERFTAHFFICCNIDEAYRASLLTHAAVLEAFSEQDIAAILAASKEKKEYSLLRFTSISPINDTVYLRFDQYWNKELEKFYNAPDRSGNNCFVIDKPVPETLADLYAGIGIDFTKIDYFRLDYKVNQFAIDHPPERLHAELRQISNYLEDVRFLIMPQGEKYMDEVIIESGILYVYRHLAESDLYDDRLEYHLIHVIINNDEDMHRWVYHELMEQLLLSDIDDKRTQYYLDKINLLAVFGNPPKDPRLAFVKAKWELKKGNTETALEYFKEAEGIKRHAAVYSYRALAWCKAEQWANADRDIATYINEVVPQVHEQLIDAGNMFLDAGFPVQAATLLQAALEKNRQHENELLELQKTSSYLKEEFYDKLLSENSKKRLTVNAGLDKILNKGI